MQKPTNPCNCPDPNPTLHGDACTKCCGLNPKIPDKKTKRRKS